MSDQNETIAVVGAGLVGTLLAILLSRRGYRCELYERRGDIRKLSRTEGRSINLAISVRGIHALERIGMAESVLQKAIPMRGRMMHSVEGELTFQPYGREEWHYINSISRAGLNRELLDEAEHKYQIPIHFEHKLVAADLSKRKLTFDVGKEGRQSHVYADLIFGTDGASSVLRQELRKEKDYQFEEITSTHSYKELTIPELEGRHQMERDALHIWPRGQFMLIALPNFDGTFTCTLFLPTKGEVSFESLKTDGDVLGFFETYFRDSIPLVEDLTKTFFANPTGHLSTIKCFPWSNKEKTVAILGDAAHAINPFFGQGMNCGFEDCTTLDDLMGEHKTWKERLAKFEKARKPNADAIAQMSLENFIEMRDLVADPAFLVKKQVEKLLEEKFPGKYVSRYTMVSFTRTPYKEALDRGAEHAKMLKELCGNLSQADKVDLGKAAKLIQDISVPER